MILLLQLCVRDLSRTRVPCDRWRERHRHNFYRAEVDRAREVQGYDAWHNAVDPVMYDSVRHNPSGVKKLLQQIS